MTPERWRKVKEICFAVLDREPDERSAALRELCAGDDELRRDVEVMIADACREESVYVAASPRAVATPAGISPLAALAGGGAADWKPEVIGEFRIVRIVGEGGMGVVYEARQQEPSRTVALKVIRPGLATPEVLRRFRQEAHALGRLQHPGIAQIYETGTADTPFGPQPYFAMEFIRGQSLRAYAEQHHPSVRHRLELIARICDAVHHAHQRGLIHRDLKPSNILIDDTGQPKVLDFGVARLTDSDLHATHQTDLGQLIGTLAYMSPEQVTADPLELDIRSDVYALGVILYEQLAGRLPYTISTRIPEAVKTIQQEDPQRLSSVSRSYRGDLETIASKALEKDKNRRYGSAAALAADIRRYLGNEPISARPASATYQLQKFARRHRALMTGIVAVILALTAGIVATTREALRARRAEGLAEARAVEAGEQRHRAEAQTVISDNERKRAEAEELRASAAAAVAATERDRAKSRLQDIRRLAGSFLFEFHDGIKDLPGSMNARELVVKRALEYLDRLSGEPDQDVDFRRELGDAYLRIADIQGHPFSPSLGRSADALVSYRKARDIFESIARDSPSDRGRALNMSAVVSERMGQIMARMGDTAAGLKEQQRAAKVFTMTAKEEPGNLVRQRNLTIAHQNLGDSFLRMGDLDTAMREYRTMQENCLRLLAKDPIRAEYRSDLAYSHQKIGDLLFFRRGEIDGALLEYQKLLDIRRPLVAENPNNGVLKRELLMGLERMGVVITRQKDFPKALEYLEQAQQIARDLSAADAKNAVVKRDLMSLTSNVAEVQLRMGRTDDAIASFNEAIATARELLAINPKSAQYRDGLAGLEYNRAEMLARKSELDGAQAGYESSRTMFADLTKEDAQNVSYKEQLAIVYRAMGNLARKRESGEEACQRYRQAADLFAAIGSRLSGEHTATAKEVEQLVHECSAK